MNQHGEAHHRRTIVVGVDGSWNSVQALRWAARQAEIRGARIHAVQVWSPPVGTWFAPPPRDRLPSWGSNHWGADVLRELHETITEALGDPPAGLRASSVSGNPAECLIEIAQADDAELLVVGHRGRGGFAQLLLGSVSQQCFTHATCPVAVIRA